METTLKERAEYLLQAIRREGLAAPPRIRFGGGELAQLDQEIASLGREMNILLIFGRHALESSGLRPRVEQALTYAGARPATEWVVSGEPTVKAVDEAVEAARAASPDLVLAIGGGSVVDTAKAVAALLTNSGSVEDYLEGVGRGFHVERDPTPLIAVPTTAGTGAEMTKNAVVADHAKGFKKSMRDIRMIPTVALLDPDTTLSVPSDITAAGGMDAITQLIEPCISAKRTAATTRLAGQALEGTRDALAACCRTPSDRAARSVMALAAGLSGVVLANAGLGLVHGVASGLGGLHPVAHGLICGVLLPHALRFNRDACEPELSEALRHFLGEQHTTADTVDRGIRAIETLKRDIGLPEDLSFLGFTDTQVREIAAHSIGSSMNGNPIPMTPDSIYQFLRPLTGPVTPR